MRSMRRTLAVVAVGALGAGALVGVTAAPAGAEPIAFAIEEGNGCRLVQLDIATGGVTPVSGGFDVAACVADLAFAADGTLYGLRQQGEEESSTVTLVRFDTTTGTTSDVGQVDGVPAGLADGGLTVDATGLMFGHVVTDDPGCDLDFVCLLRIDPTNPESATFVGRVPQFQTEYFGLASSCAGQTVSVRAEEEVDGNSTDAAWPFGDAPTADAPEAPADPAAELEQPAGVGLLVQILTVVDLATASTSDVGPVGPGNFVDSVDFDATGALWGVGFANDPSPRNTVYSIDPATGAASPSADVEGDTSLTSLAIEHSCAAPEAAPIVLAPTFTG